MAIITSQPITGDLLKIDNAPVPEVKEYTVAEKKVYRDNNTNMSGQVRATLLGITPVINISLRHMNRGRANEISAILDTEYFDVTYFDPSLNTTRTAQYFASDYWFELEDKDRGIMKAVQITLNPIAMR